MFRIVCMVEDRNLPKVLHAVSGLVVGMEPPQPVVNAVVKKGEVKEAAPGSNKRERFIAAIQNNPKGAIVTTADLVRYMTEAGGAPKSIGNLLTGIFKDRILKRKSKGSYVVL